MSSIDPTMIPIFDVKNHTHGSNHYGKKMFEYALFFHFILAILEVDQFLG